MKNLPIATDERTSEWARVEAAKSNTIASRQAGKMPLDDAYAQAYQDWRNAPRTWRSDGAPYPKRDETHDRGSR